MMSKVLKVSLVLVLAISFFGFTIDKNVEVDKNNAQKIELAKKLAEQAQPAPWKSAGFKTSKITKVASNKKAANPKVDRAPLAREIQTLENAAMPILDYVADSRVAVDNFASVAGMASGQVIGTSDFTYGTAYYGRNIDMGNDGVVHAQWTTVGDPSNVVLYSKSTDGGATWTTPIVANDGYYGYKAAIAVDYNNPQNIHIVYIGYINSGETRTCRYVKSEDGGDTWLPSILVAGSNVNTNNPDIAVDSQGNPHLVMDSYSDTFIRYNYSTDGGATFLAEPEIVNTGFGEETFGACISIDKNDNPHVLFGGGGTAGSWGDKQTYWNWRDMGSGAWQEVPPVHASEGVSITAGTPYPSMVFDSDNIGHLFFDANGTTAGRGGWYRTYDPNAGWSNEVTEILPNIPGGYVMMIQAGIDENDNLFIGYLDGLGGGMDLEPSFGDFFTGTNISGDWEFTNVSGSGTAVDESHPNVSRHVLSADSVFHCLYISGPGPVEVNYEKGFPWPTNPSVAVNQLPDTYEQSGPFTITATTSDLNGTTEQCSLYVWLNDEMVDMKEMTSTAPDVWEADFTVDAMPGDVVQYQAIGIDNDGEVGNSFLTMFDVMFPENPAADILLVGDDIYIPEVYTKVLSELGYVFEYWDVVEHNGIDNSVTNWGWSTILIAGWNLGTVPTRDYAGNPYADFLDNGGNLALMSMDYFFANDEEAGDIFFDPGDFAYDYFQLGGGTNDPGQDMDSLMIGIGGDPISGSWDTEPLEFNVGLADEVAALINWMDWTTATGGAFDIFFAYNQGFGAGVSYDAGTFKTVFLPWMFSWLIEGELDAFAPTEDAYTLMQNILDFFGTVSPPIFSMTEGPTYGVYGYGPFDVAAVANDFALAKTAEVAAMEVGYALDDEMTFTYVPMTSVGNGRFEGQIPEIAAGEHTVYYVFKATDEDGNFNVSFPNFFYTTGLEYTEGVKLLYCGDDPYDWYYGGSIDSVVTATLDQLAADKGFSYDYWDVDFYGPPDYHTVLSNYSSVIWHGYADWFPEVFPIATVDNPLYPFIMNGGNLLFSSEEMLGTLYDYPDDYATMPGEAVYDVLNVAWIGADWNYDTIRLFDTADPLAVGMDSLIGLVELPFSYMADLADPVMLDAYVFDGYLAPVEAWYGAYGGGITWRYDNPETGSKSATMPFCLANLDDANRYAFMGNVVDWFGVSTAVENIVSSDLPTTYALHDNYPNPFNPETAIAYDLPKSSRIELNVYNVLGQKIRTLVSAQKAAGRYMAIWDGKDDYGVQASSGVYFYRLKAGDFVQNHKMMLIK